MKHITIGCELGMRSLQGAEVSTDSDPQTDWKMLNPVCTF